MKGWKLQSCSKGLLAVRAVPLFRGTGVTAQWKMPALKSALTVQQPMCSSMFQTVYIRHC